MLAVEFAAGTGAAAELERDREIGAPIAELEGAGYIAVDVGLAPARARGASASYAGEDFGVRVTPAGIAALDARDKK